MKTHVPSIDPVSTRRGWVGCAATERIAALWWLKIASAWKEVYNRRRASQMFAWSAVELDLAYLSGLEVGDL